jgi:hypothetical protein
MSHVTIDQAGKLVLCLHSILGQLTGEHLRSLIDSLSCEEQVIEQVAKQIVDGWTDMTSCGASRGARAWIEDGHIPALDRARMYLHARADEETQKDLGRLKDLARRAEAEAVEHRKARHEAERKLSEAQDYIRELRRMCGVQP